MQIIGKWLRRVDTPEGHEAFKSLYKVTWHEMLVEHEVFHITRISKQDKSAIVFLEYEGTFAQVFSLEDNEHLMVYSDDCSNESVFNTDGMAFMRLVREGSVVGTFCVENSPYDMLEEDFEQEDLVVSEVMEKLNQLLAKYEIEPTTFERVLFVRQL